MSRRSARARPATSAQSSAAKFLSSPLRRAAIAVICAKLALIPVVFDPDSDVPFSVIKALLSHALAYVLAGLLLALDVQHGRVVFRWSWLHVPVLGFLVTNVAATLVAADLLLALYGAHTRMSGLGTIADGVLLYFAIAFLVRTSRDVLALALSFLAGSVVVLAYAFVQFAGRDPFDWAIDSAARPFSTIGQTTNLAEYLTVVAVGAAAVALFQNGLRAPVRVALIFYAALAIADTVVTQTRSAFLGMVAGAVLLVLLTWSRHPSPRARVVSVVGAAGAAALMAVVLLATPLGARLLTTIEAPAAAEGDAGLRLEGAADVRLALYRIALEMVRDRPLLGHGPDNFFAALPRFRSDAEPFEVQDNPTTSAHSWAAQVAATSGVVGLAFFVGIAATAVALTFRGGFRPVAWAALGMLAAFLGAGVTTVHAIATDWIFWTAVGVIAATTSDPVARDAPSSPARRGRVAPATADRAWRTPVAYGIVVIGLVFALTTFNAVDASRAAKASQIARLQGQARQAIDLGLRSTRSDPRRAQYWDTLGLAYVSDNRLGDAVTAFERASALAPYDVRYHGDLARALAAPVLRGDRTTVGRAREVADRAVRTDPNNPLAHQTRAVVMHITGELPEALKSSERALALDRLSSAGETSNPEIYLSGVQILHALGRNQDAIALARRCLNQMPYGSRQMPIRIELSRVLVATGQLADALSEIDAALVISPGSVDAQRLRAQIRAALNN